MVSDLTKEGVLKRTERDLIQNTIRYDDMTVANSMTPREHMTFVKRGERLESIKKMFLETNYSRVPVVNGSPDHVLGIMYRVDFYEMLLAGKKSVPSILKPAFYVNHNDKLSQALKKMQKARQTVAVVRNGQKIVGLLTMDDIIEELVGEMQDMYDIVPNEQTAE